MTVGYTTLTDTSAIQPLLLRLRENHEKGRRKNSKSQRTRTSAAREFPQT